MSTSLSPHGPWPTRLLCPCKASEARILETVAISCSKGSSQPRDQTTVPSVSCIGRRILSHWVTEAALRMAQVENPDSPECRQGVGRQGLCFPAGGNGSLHDSLAVSYTTGHALILHPAATLLDVCPGGFESCVHTKPHRTWRHQDALHWLGEWVSKLWYIQITEYYSVLKGVSYQAMKKTWRRNTCLGFLPFLFLIGLFLYLLLSCINYLFGRLILCQLLCLQIFSPILKVVFPFHLCFLYYAKTFKFN